MDGFEGMGCRCLCAGFGFLAGLITQVPYLDCGDLGTEHGGLYNAEVVY